MSLANDKSSIPVLYIAQNVMLASRLASAGFQNVITASGCRFASGNVMDSVTFVGETGPGADYDSVVKIGDKYLQLTFTSNVPVTVEEYIYTSSGWKTYLKSLVPIADSTAGALTITAAMIRKGLILRDPNGAARSDVTPTAALLVAAFPGCKAEDTFKFTIVNTADGAETITVTAGSGITLWPASQTIAQNTAGDFIGRFVTVTLSSEAVTIYKI
jgi:hypothetical protein